MKRCQHTRHLYPQNTEEAVTVVLAAHYSKKGGQLMRYSAKAQMLYRFVNRIIRLIIFEHLKDLKYCPFRSEISCLR